MMIDDAVFQVGEGEDKATMFSKCKMSLAKQVSFDLLANMDSVLALFFKFFFYIYLAYWIKTL